MKLRLLLCMPLWLCCVCLAPPLHAETVFLEAESFAAVSNAGPWSVTPATKPYLASQGNILRSPGGSKPSAAERGLTLREAGRYRLWVRAMQAPSGRAPFSLAVSGEKELARQEFGIQADPKIEPFDGRWDFLEADLPAGNVKLTLRTSPTDPRGAVCQVDCLVLTTNLALVPDHRDFGPQTYMRVTLGAGYDDPAYIQAFVPFVGHYAFSKNGMHTGTTPRPNIKMKPGDTTGWCNISRMLYPSLRVGSRPRFTARRSYSDILPRLNAVFEFATAPDPTGVVKRIEVDYTPGTLYLCLPTDLSTPEQLARFTVDRELAETTGRQADAFLWPAIGRKPQRYPFFATFIGEGVFLPDARLVERERKTLDYFGFVNDRMTWVHAGTWQMISNSYLLPDLNAMRAEAAEKAARFKADGRFTPDDIAYVKLMDEPAARKTDLVAADPAYTQGLRKWLREIGQTPESLLVKSWDDVRMVTLEERDRFPALHYFTQRFRVRALGAFFSTQSDVVAEAFGRKLPCMGNFSDVAVFAGNLYRNGADYFELLDAAPQRAVWSECGGALATSSQCTDYNVDLMRGAATHGEQLGHYLISYGRPMWDVKCKAVGHAARGVKALMDYYYGPTWYGYEGGPTWKTGAWYAHPEKWYGMAELVREFGGAEDLLVPALPAKAETAILYPSSSDIWTLERNHAYGYDRMHLWMALQHAQVPVDILSERQVADGALAAYKVCYLSGPNLTRAAASNLTAWVRRGGVLFASAGAGAYDEFNRPVKTLDDLLPAAREPAKEPDPFLIYGSALRLEPVIDSVKAGGADAVVLAVSQTLAPRPGSSPVAILGTFRNGKPALAEGPAGAGRVFQAGFLPGLSYVRPALDRREAHVQAGTEPERIARSRNPWEFPAAVRDLILAPVRAAGIEPPLRCSVPLVEATYMTCPAGIVVPLSNYTLAPLTNISLSVRAPRAVAAVESVHHGKLPFRTLDGGRIAFSLPLDSTDFVKLYYSAKPETP